MDHIDEPQDPQSPETPTTTPEPGPAAPARRRSGRRPSPAKGQSAAKGQTPEAGLFPPDPEPATGPSPAAPEPTEPGTAEPAVHEKRQGLAGVILADLGELEPFADEPSSRGGLQALLLAVMGLVLVAAVATGALIAMGKLQLSSAAASPSITTPTAQPTTDTSAEPSASPGESVATSESPAPSDSTAPSASAGPPASPTPVPVGTPFYYTVQTDETLTILAQRFGVTVDALVQANHIVDRNLILTGQRILIPAP